MTGCSINVHVVIFSLRDDALRVLLAPSADPGWELPGQPLEESDSLEACALRAFQEQASRREVYLEQLYTYGDPQRIPGGRLVSVVYFALIPADARRESGSSLRWFRLSLNRRKQCLQMQAVLTQTDIDIQPLQQQPLDADLLADGIHLNTTDFQHRQTQHRLFQLRIANLQI